jgi:uncharacterized membrane protein
MATVETAPALNERRSARIEAIDIVRGVVMLLMAIDHVRVYSGVPAGGPSPGIFFTRWITHFVAPAFAFFAGTSAYLHGRKLGKKSSLAFFLITRGIFLVVMELTVIRVLWTFNFDFKNYLLAGVIWMLGICMVLMAALIWLPDSAIATIGVAIIALHNLADVFRPSLAGVAQNGVAKILYFGGGIEPNFYILYSIIPWIGVMAAGYAFGRIAIKPAAERNRIALIIGGVAILAFVVLRALDGYGDPRKWNPQPKVTTSSQGAATASPSPARPQAPAAIRFLNTAKYPASLDFLLMTLGPTLVLFAFSDRISGWPRKILDVFGRVPMFYYLLHIPLIHVLAIAVSAVRTPQATGWLFTNHPMAPPDAPAGYMWSLGLLYAIWVLTAILLYFPCAWYAKLKRRSKNPLLSYV